MINVGIVTATRAEYGLLKPLCVELKKYNNVDLKLIVTGTHLSRRFGFTIRDILDDGLKIDKKIRIIDDNKKQNIAEIFSNSILEFDKYVRNMKFDVMILLGDRYETLAFAIICLFNNIPICHLYGGETTEGAIDEAIRHSITKMSYLHFASCMEYKNRIIQLGEDPKRVYNVGSIGVENVLKTKLYSKSKMSRILGINLDKYFVVTYHPVTLESDNNKGFNVLLKALSNYKDYQIVFTKSNADRGGNSINKLIDVYVNEHKNAIAFFSLGTKKYLSLVKYSKAVIGNSSSGLSEVPALCVPTVNIGNRQRGRIKVQSVIDCKNSIVSINNAIKKAIEFNDKLNIKGLPFYKKNTSYNIAKIIVNRFNKKIDLMKKFYDIKGEV